MRVMALPICWPGRVTGKWAYGPSARISGRESEPSTTLPSGDNHPGDGRHTTFDDLYPAGYNKYGMADPFAWRNLRNVSGGVDWSLSQRWRVGFGCRLRRPRGPVS